MPALKPQPINLNNLERNFPYTLSGSEKFARPLDAFKFIKGYRTQAYYLRNGNLNIKGPDGQWYEVKNG